MANKTIADLTAATLPAAGTELTHVLQGANSRKLALSDYPVSTPTAALLAALLPLSFLNGLTLSNNVTDATNDIDIAAGAARGNALTVVNASAITKRLDATWAAGTNQGGLDTGSKANSTVYHMHAIRKTSDASFDVLFSASATAPTVPSGWAMVRVLGAVITDGSSVIRPFFQIGPEFRLTSIVADVSATVTTTATLHTLTVPPGSEAIVQANSSDVFGYGAYISSPLATDQAADIAVNANVLADNAGSRKVVELYLFTDSSRRVRARATGSMNVRINTKGWVDHRLTQNFF